ncbi:MAG: hypothetical protein A2268_14605 [Candidatus Raymondbacteria bacterium RifOxyA12_full_50_37]|uniref:RND efflux pump membrane fusion protein barrel-sandwich domain-containing protein n=1 Tax=Candidatus Raymondbacteria bacterium RIFOXYD12_FULL_49_13 TaxID=1817890 RepID=A0A1F7F2N5_UNCRA|nr:MAG: hypothetical protein A2268_14605 [Candidatus Raymondbacteria bacterium RifOxyA12_full_50_37]OGJ88650.1 MAG: hypothetical protein A2248_20540 [Candidatus Raymondbacteria bacterium RIFOXYA2_FULL_49_16]OGK00822.1 MAG: hypothetical protein A2519_07795 [Candidatus Raymondbacteria bacterium RIFOXYD12_FULL_49_13]OGK02875.1 MAG: hypothetical protein A2487_17770 [Candidatus Raymondbacteria bacterium RifOxyC12_full_50_8]OGP41686.1 MAG: hypothetical protein A2324_07625 [Candidatus Raymondbacteria 
MRNIIIAMAVAALVLTPGCGEKHEKAHEEHGKEGHEEKAVVPEEHGGEHSGHGHEGEEDAVALPEKIAAKIGLATDKVRMGRVKKTLGLPGEVVPNGDKVVHVVPRFPGIVKEVRKNIGDHVKEGEVLATVESNENLSLYNVVAHGSGRIIEKHVVPGEFVNEERDLFIIADLSEVWVNIAVYGKDAAEVAFGQRVTIEAVGGKTVSSGTISYISPIFSEATRSLAARVVLPNPNNIWRPGTFIKASFDITSDTEVLLVCNEAVQIINEKSCVFMKEDGDEYHPVPVQLGVQGKSHTEILSGLSKDAEYVCKGAFELKAQLTLKSLGGGHAGHGH